MPKKMEKIFELFYKFTRGNVDLGFLTDEEKIMDLYENIVKTIYKEMFSNVLKLGMVMKNTL